MKCRLHIFTKNCSCLHEHCSLLFTCQQIIVRVRKQYIHSCRERALNNTALSTHQLPPITTSSMFNSSAPSYWWAFDLFRQLSTYILYTYCRQENSQQTPWPDAELSPFYRGQSCPFCHYLCRYTELNLSSYILKCTYKFLETIMQFFEIEVDIIIYMTNYMIRKNLTHESWISVVLTLLIIDIIILMKTLLIWYVICYIYLTNR